MVVATPDDEIARVVTADGGEAVLTGPASCGTDRVFLVAGDAPGLVINVQGDMPLLDPRHIELVLELLCAGAPIATLATPLTAGLHQPEIVKVRIDDSGRATGFSRQPFGDEVAPMRHIGIYGFGDGVLARAVTAPPSEAARRESLEQLRWLDAGIPIHVATAPSAAPGVDTIEQLEWVRRSLSRSGQEVS